MVSWQAPPLTRPGGQAWYPGVQIELALMLRLALHLVKPSRAASLSHRPTS